MRDAFGGAFMIKLFLVFIFIYVAFTAIALNYAKAFRVKNKIIDFLETNEISDLDSWLSEGSGANLASLTSILEKYNYNVKCRDGSGNEDDTNRVIGSESDFCFRGVMFKITSNTGNSNKYVYYKVTTAVDWNLGILNNILSFGGGSASDEDPLSGTWKISGESRIIYTSTNS